MPPRAKAHTAPDPEPEEKKPEETPAVPSDTNEPQDQPADATPADDDPKEPEATEPKEPEDVPSEPEAEDAPETEAEEGGTELGLSPGEEFISQRLRDDAVLVVVTNFGRKIEIDPDGHMTVVTGPPLDVIVPAQPVSTAVGVLGPRPEAG